MAASEAKERYRTLDAMRGLAALAVAAYHFQQRTGNGSIAGYLAVDLFFVLSGFVVALNYTDRFAMGLTVRRFVELRMIRLLPLYALGMTLGLTKLLVGFMLHIAPAAALGSVPCAAAFGIAMLPDPCSPELFPLNGPSWSLLFELAINIAFAILLWRATRLVLASLMAVSAIYLLWRVGSPDYFNLGWAWHNLDGGIARTVYSFCAGVVLFRILPPKRPKPGLVALIPVSAVIGILIFAGNTSHRAMVEIIIVCMVFPAFIASGCLFDIPGPAIRRLSGFLGDLSYPVYSIHWPLVTVFSIVLERFELSVALSTFLFLAAITFLGYGAMQIDIFARTQIKTMGRPRWRLPLRTL